MDKYIPSNTGFIRKQDEQTVMGEYKMAFILIIMSLFLVMN